MRNKNPLQEEYEEVTSMVEFVNNYNQISPDEFPNATIASMKKFRDSHSSLGLGDNQWSIEKHRKKVMDWLFSNV